MERSDDLLALVKAALAEADRQESLLVAARLAECVYAIETAHRR